MDRWHTEESLVDPGSFCDPADKTVMFTLKKSILRISTELESLVVLLRLRVNFQQKLNFDWQL